MMALWIISILQIWAVRYFALTLPMQALKNQSHQARHHLRLLLAIPESRAYLKVFIRVVTQNITIASMNALRSVSIVMTVVTACLL